MKTALWAVLTTTAPVLLFGSEGPGPISAGPDSAVAAAQLLALLLWELPPLAGSVLRLVAFAQLCLTGYFLLFRFFEPGGRSSRKSAPWPHPGRGRLTRRTATSPQKGPDRP